jgi:RNA polymerase sigma-70 factor (ECF subfamily)
MRGVEYRMRRGWQVHSRRVADDSQDDALATSVRAKLASGELAAATTLVVHGFGPQILGYLTAMARHEADANDAFSQFCEDLWRGLPGFEWRTSLRTWCYVLARNALYRQRQGAPQRHGAHVAPSQVPELAALAERVRTATAEFMRTETRSRFTELRDGLDPDDRTLLILRIDRRMPWRDIAEVLAPSDESSEPDAITRRAAALRKRFERLKLSLREHLGVGQGKREP